MLDCYIADDNQSMIKLLSDYIQDTPNLKLVAATTNPLEMAARIGQVRVPSIAFFDIDMPGITGLQLAALTNSSTAVIFITAHPQHAVDAFSEGAYDYLMKPFSYLRFIEAVNKVRARLSALFTLPFIPEDHGFVYNRYGDLIKIHYDDIIYIKSNQNYIEIKMTNGTLESRLSLIDVLATFPKDIFFQIHKSYIISINRMTRISSGNFVIMDKDNHNPIMIGRAYRHQLMEHIGKLTTRHHDKNPPDKLK